MQNSIPVLSSPLPFPPIYWWQEVIRASSVLFDKAEHFEKMSYRNRYYIVTANGKHCLSIPLANGRDQHSAMVDVKIAGSENWQQQHWRTLFSAYNRSPYFEFYRDDLEQLFLQKFDSLVEFNLATIHWVKKQLRCDFQETVVEHYEREYYGVSDIRRIKPQQLMSQTNKSYNQVFSDRNGFISQLSILDLLFNEGKFAAAYLKG